MDWRDCLSFNVRLRDPIRIHVMSSYVDFAEYYDLDHAITFDLPFYLEFAESFGGPILELACGTGRIAIPLAKAGFDVRGLDVSTPMLEVCRRRIESEDLGTRLDVEEGDMANFDLPSRGFSLAIIGLRSFMHLLTQEDQRSCLEAVHRHLKPGGHLILSVVSPDQDQLTRPVPGEFEVRREFNLPNGHHVVRKDRLVEHDPVQQVRRFEFRFEEHDDSGVLTRERTIPLVTRYAYCKELKLLLEMSGFSVEHVFGGYDRSDFEGTGDLILVARR